VGIVLLPGIPLFPLMWVSQALNAIFLPVLLVLMVRLASDARLMGKYRNSRTTNVLAWGTIVLIVAVTLVLFASPLLWHATPS
jgi:Mn2+/Fe2+ NRAMP family transporter